MDYKVVNTITINASRECAFDAVIHEWCLYKGTKDHPAVRHPEGPIMEGTEIHVSSPKHDVFLKICFKKLDKPNLIFIRQEMPSSSIETVIQITGQDGMLNLNETCTMIASNTEIFFTKLIYWWKTRKLLPLQSIKDLAESDQNLRV